MPVNEILLRLLIVCLGLPVGGRAFAAGRVDFNRDVRPILGGHCLQCHGPDAHERKAGLRLDVAEAAKSKVIIPGQPDGSELVRRIFATDDDQMPPAETKKRLTEAQKATLRQWIEQGAEYQDHWAFLPIGRPTPPEVRHEDRVRNGIDRFILARLEREGIVPAPEADPATLIRRIQLDLTGLLPDPEEVNAFRRAHAADADRAVADLVNRLLPTYAHGERWGRHWLDQARYADSHGYTIDGDRIMWPYRDWVIRAIRDDMPFDQFTIEQLAGDLLPNPTKSQLVATGFHRNTLINQEGGTDDEQFRNEEVVDRVNTTGAVWLGLTVGCAQCHSHKFDPITQREYYELFDFFNHSEDVNNQGPTVSVQEGELLLTKPDPGRLAELEKANAVVTKLERSRASRQQRWETRLRQESGKEGAAVWSVLRPAGIQTANGSVLALLEDQSLLGKTGGAAQENYVIDFDTKDAASVAAIRLRVLPHESLPKNGPGLAGNGNFVLTRVEVSLDGQTVPIIAADADHAQPNFPIRNVIDGNRETGWAINVGRETPKGVRMNTAHEATFTFARPIQPQGAALRVTLRHEKNNHYNIGRFALDASPTPPAARQAESLLAAIEVGPDRRTAEQKKLLADEFATADVELKEARSRVNSIRRKLGLGAEVKAMVMRDRKEPRDTYIQIRGDFLRPDRQTGKLSAGVPGIFPKLGAAGRGNRLDLARWLIRKDNPLTARVTVNRVWMHYFGRGLVETENDFGSQGTFPTHPELLDWLAGRFIDSGWSLHALHRLITGSATYRQSSHHRPELDGLDRRNLLLARQNRLRFDAEIVRDAALSASGRLSPKVGGPSVRPPQPEGVYAFTQRRRAWNAATNEDRFRRGIYTLFYRSAPYPMMTTFDAPDFQSVCTARPRSNTPLQSLTLANDEAFFELAQGLATRVLTEVKGSGSPVERERIRRAFMICYSRLPSPAEAESIADFIEDLVGHYGGAVDEAKAVAPRDAAEVPVAVAAAWASVCRALINTDEFITRE